MKLLSIALGCLFLICSLVSFAMCAIDKSAAKHEKRRIPEKRFFLWALCGGGALGRRRFYNAYPADAFGLGGAESRRHNINVTLWRYYIASQ